MKNLILTAALSLGFALTTTPAKALDAGFCSALSTTVGAMATVRDQGFGPQYAYDLMIQNGIDDEAAVVLLKLVYLDASFASPQELKDVIFTTCLSEAT